jgi:hypothetical protein
MTNKLPPLPALPFVQLEDALIAWATEYGQQCREAALEEAALVCDAQAEDAVAPKRLALMTAVGQTIQEGMYGGAKSCAGVIRGVK